MATRKEVDALKDGTMSPADARRIRAELAAERKAKAESRVETQDERDMRRERARERRRLRAETEALRTEIAEMPWPSPEELAETAKAERAERRRVRTKERLEKQAEWLDQRDRTRARVLKMGGAAPVYQATTLEPFTDDEARHRNAVALGLA